MPIYALGEIGGEGHVVPEGAWQFAVEKYLRNVATYRKDLRRID